MKNLEEKTNYKEVIIFDKEGHPSREYLLKREACCGYKCYNCPYTPKYINGSTKVGRKEK